MKLSIHLGFWIVFMLLCGLGLPFQIHAGGPLFFNGSLPVVWNSDDPVPYRLDPGGLGPFSHEEAAELVREAFLVWQNAGNTTLRFEESTLLPEDVTDKNHFQYTANVPGVAHVIFDDDGEIFDALFGSGSKEHFLGVADPAPIGPFELGFGYLVINGYFLENVDSDPGAALSTIIHEIGHIIGIDHAQFHRHLAYDGVAANDSLVPIMFPTTADDDSSRTFLTQDDKAIVNSLYRDDTFQPQTGSLSGVVIQGRNELPGINVVARRVDSPTPEVETFSTVTGYYEFGFGTFEMHGLPAGRYQLWIEPIDTFFTGASSVGRYALTRANASFQNVPPSMFYHESISQSRSAASIITVTAGNETRGIVIETLNETTPPEEQDTQILAVNSAEKGAVPPDFISEFQYVLVPSGEEGTLTISVISDAVSHTPNHAFEVLVQRERRVRNSDSAAEVSRRGIAQVTLGKNGNLPLEPGRYFIALRNLAAADLLFTIRVDDELHIGALDPTPTSTPAAVPPSLTPTFTSTATPRPVFTPAPTRSASETPSSTPGLAPTATAPVSRTTPSPTPTRTPTPTVTQVVPSPTAREVNLNLGLISMDHLGTVFLGGKAERFFSGLSVFPELLIFNGESVPIARDMEFSGEFGLNREGLEGIYYLNGGMVQNLPPVTGRFGAQSGGIDTDNNKDNNINFGGFTSDPIPNDALINSTTDPDILYPLVDIEPAGNNGYYVLARNGKIFAEGGASRAIERRTPPGSFPADAVAADMVIFRGTEIVMRNSLYSEDLIGIGAYIMDTQGRVYTIGNPTILPRLNTNDATLFPPGVEMPFQDMELIPDPAGEQWIGLGLLNGNGLIQFLPFADTEITPEVQRYLRVLNPFGSLQQVFNMDIARDFAVEITDEPLYGLSSRGITIPTTGRRIGIFLIDGFGGIHTGGETSVFVLDENNREGNTRVITLENGEQLVGRVIPILIPFVGTDSIRDIEILPHTGQTD